MASGKVTGRKERKTVAEDVTPPTPPRSAVRRPPLGGDTDGRVQFTELQLAILRAASDEIIPPGDGFPAPSEVGVVEDFMPRYITPAGEEPTHFPFVAEDRYKAAAETLGQEFVDAGSDRRVEILARVERDQPEFFDQLRSLVYYGYYSRPAVTEAIRVNLEAGHDYRGAPQPYGYVGTIEDWDLTALPRGRGRYIPTTQVKRVQVQPASETLVASHPGS